MAEETKEMPANIDDAFSNLDTTLSKHSGLRDKILLKLMEAAENVDLSQINSLRASDRESLMGVFTTVDSVMKSQEAAQVNQVRLLISRKTEETNANHADAVLELLKRVDPSAVVAGSLAGGSPSEEVDTAIDSVYADGDDDISEEELEPVSP